MEAIIKGTGEKVDVSSCGMMSIKCAAYKDEHGRMIPGTALEFHKHIDWEQRRYELAKAAMQSYYSNLRIHSEEAQNATSWAINIADEMIKQLKQE